MEIKNWTYEEFPEFSEEVPGAKIIKTTGDEQGIIYLHDVEYMNACGTPLHLQILIPSTRNRPFNMAAENQKNKLPCFVFVQGSAWFQQYLYGQVTNLAKLAERGFVCAIVEYRHSGIAPFPAPVIDARNAVRYLRKNAERYGIDPEKMVLAGDSSGGHVAMFAGILHNDETEENAFRGISGEVKGLVDYYGSVSVMLPDGNPSTINHHMPDSPEGREAGGVNLLERDDLRRAMSVEENITADTEIAPTLIFHGTKDRTVNCKESVLLYNAMKRAGKEVKLYLIKGADHGGAEFWTKEVLDIVEEFIRDCISRS